MPPLKIVPVRICENCTLPIARRRWRKRRGVGNRVKLVPPTIYARLRFCGKKCEGEFRRKYVAPHFCEACGSRLVRHVVPNGELESAKNFKRRRHCDGHCAALAFGNRGHHLAIAIRGRSFLAA